MFDFVNGWYIRLMIMDLTQKIAIQVEEVWVIRILAIVAVLFIMGIIMVDNYGNNKTIQKNVERNFTNVFDWKPFRDSSAWDVTRKYLPVNLILLFIPH